MNNNEEENRKYARKIGEDAAGDVQPTPLDAEDVPAFDVFAEENVQDVPEADVSAEKNTAAYDAENTDEPKGGAINADETAAGTFGKNKFKEQKNKTRKPWSTKNKVILIVGIVIIAAAAVTAGIFLLTPQTLAGKNLQQIVDNGTFYDGVSMAGVDLSGKTMDEAKSELAAEAQKELAGISVDYVVNEDEYTLDSAQLGAKIDTDEALMQAMIYGRQGTFAERSKQINDAKTQGIEIELPIIYDKETILASVTANDEKINVPAADAAVVMTKQSDEDKLFTDMQIDYKDATVGLEVDSAALADTIYAQLEQNNFEPVTAQTNVVQPKLTLEQIKDKYAVIGDFTTKYGSSAFGRKYNVWKMADIINGVEIKPGETWSINKEAGPRTFDRGWKGAPGISDGEYKEEAGGGICQTNSTLYGAVLRAEVKVVDRTHHSWPLDYVDGGLDATISTGAPDFKIQNNYDVPIFIISKCDGNAGVIRMQIYGPKFADGLTREFTSELTNTFGGGRVNYIDDPSLPTGTEKQIIKEHLGKTYQTYKHYIDADGKEVKVEKFSVETYDNKPAKVRRGTGAPVEPVAPPVEPTPPVTPTPPAPSAPPTPSAEPTPPPAEPTPPTPPVTP
ncbi:MAG: VanW family protein [Christensenella sp.]